MLTQSAICVQWSSESTLSATPTECLIFLNANRPKKNLSSTYLLKHIDVIRYNGLNLHVCENHSNKTSLIPLQFMTSSQRLKARKTFLRKNKLLRFSFKTFFGITYFEVIDIGSAFVCQE